MTKVDEDYPDNKLTGATFEVYKDVNGDGKLDDGDELIGKLRKVGGLYGLYLHYCYKLGFLPKYQKQNPARLHYLLREDLMKLDQITAQVRLLGREHISTSEQLFSYKP